jgi:hypothetical protein
MKTLSVIQPWASLILLGKKRFETRSWKTAHRGPLLIHSSAKIPPAAQGLCYQEPFKTALASLLLPYKPPTAPDGNVWNLPRGALLGIVELVNVVTVEQARAQIGLDADELAFGDYRPGRYAWELAVVEVFQEPLKVPGHLGLWDVPEQLLDDTRRTGGPVGAFGIHRPTERTH